MHFVKIHNLDCETHPVRIINLELVTLVNPMTLMLDGQQVDGCTVTYHMGGGTMTSFTLDCTPEQFMDYMYHVFQSVEKPPTYQDYLNPPQEPNSCNGNGKAQ